MKCFLQRTAQLIFPTAACFFLLSLPLYCAQTEQAISIDTTTPLQTTATMSEDTRFLVEVLEKAHYLQQPLSQIDADLLIDNYMKAFDRNRLFFYAADSEEFKMRFGSNIIQLLRRGNLYPGVLIFEHYRERVRQRTEWILERLQQPFDFTVEETYAPDRSEADWLATRSAADELWNLRLKYELLNELLSSRSDHMSLSVMDPSLDVTITDNDEPVAETRTENPPVAEEKSFDEKLELAIEAITKRYQQLQRSVENIEAHEVQEVFLTTLTNLYDPHSTFLSADSREEFAIAMGNSLVGIGAVLTEDDGSILIRELLPGGPAEKSGELQPNDQIVGVAQGDAEPVDTFGMKLRRVVKLIRGEKGSEVRLLIRPADGDPSERKVVSLIRDEIKLTANLARAELYTLPGDDTQTLIGVINLPAFYGAPDHSDKPATTSDVNELIQQLKALGVQGIILDLRRNGGGILNEAIDLTGLFIPLGPVVQVREWTGNIRQFSNRDPQVAWDGPLIVLTSRFSASASEIVAGALRNYQRALIVGDSSTHGKGTVQTLFEFNPQNRFRYHPGGTRGAAKITIQKYYLPDGSSTQIEGVSSDIVLPSFNEFLPIGEGDLPNAMAWDTVPPLSFKTARKLVGTDSLVSQPLIDYLRNRSDQRQLELEEFQFLNENIRWFQEKQEQKDFSLHYLQRLQQVEDDEAFRLAMRERRKELAENDYANQEVLLQLTLAQQDEDEEEADDPADHYDIHLRETLRIMADWIQLSSDSSKEQTLAAYSNSAENTN